MIWDRPLGFSAALGPADGAAGPFPLAPLYILSWGATAWGKFGVLSWYHAEVWGSIRVSQGLMQGPLGLGAKSVSGHKTPRPPNLSGIFIRATPQPSLELISIRTLVPFPPNLLFPSLILAGKTAPPLP